MARFNFRLQTLRKLREIHRDEQHARLAMAYEAERILSQQRAEMAAQQQAAADEQRTRMLGAEVDVNQLLSSQRYRLALETQARALADQAEQVAAEVERRRQAVVEADREVRVLDKLEDRQRRAHRQAAAQAETKRLDEVATTRWKGVEP